MNHNKATTVSSEKTVGTVFPFYGGLYGSLIRYLDLSCLKTDKYARIGSECVKTFSASLEERGFLRPVFIDEDLNVVDGMKRIAAAQAMGFSAVPCVYSPTPLVFEDDVLICRLIREAPDFFSYASILSRLKEVYLYSQEAIAGALGKSQSFVANKLRLLKFSSDEREIIRNANLTERHCRALLALRNPADRRRALDITASGGLSVAATEELAASFIGETSVSKLKRFETDLRRLAEKYAPDGSAVEIQGDLYPGSAIYTVRIKE